MLSKPIQLLISASPLSKASFGYVARIGMITYSVLQINSSAHQMNEVESCNCPSEYTGLSCESCSEGFYHYPVNNGISSCVPCQCHKHAYTCHKETGICVNCMHNTIGKNCQICSPGYYGNATHGSPFDCTRCPCKEPQTTSSLCSQSIIDNSISCLNCSTGYEGKMCNKCTVGYYQSYEQCVPCKCHNNSFNCNPITGVCLDCSFNTKGDHCEKCKDGWYGNATQQKCRREWTYIYSCVTEVNVLKDPSP